MVSVITNDRCLKLVGLSTDTKPTGEAIGNGSVFYEMDTGKVFIMQEGKNEQGERTTSWTEVSGATITFTL